MFIHAVLFEIKPREVLAYRKDSRMWAAYARKMPGFLRYTTVKRMGYRNQFASAYEWKTQRAHERFIRKFHGLLVAKSRARVKVLGYYNLKAIDRIR